MALISGFAGLKNYSRALADDTEETPTVKELEVEWQTGDAEVNDDGIGTVKYDGNPHGYTATVTDRGITVQYRLNGSDSWSASQPVKAGEYTVRAVLNEPDPDYVIPESANRTLIIKALPLHVRWQAEGARTDAVNGLHWIYDGEVHTLTAKFDGLIVKDTADGRVTPVVTIAVGHGVGIDHSTNTLSPLNAGSYSAFAKIGGDASEASDNYYIVNSEEEETEYAVQEFKITQRSVAVSWTKNPLNGTYVWVYSGYQDETVMHCALENSTESATGYTGLIDKDGVTSSVTYATVTDGVVGKYDGTVRVNAGVYIAKASISDENYVLTNAELNYNIVAREVRVEWNGLGSERMENGVYIWRYDGATHVPAASAELPSDGDGAVSGGVKLDEYITVTGAESEVTSLSGKTLYEASATLGSHIVDGFDICSNFTLTNTVVNFRIDRGIISSENVTWFTNEGEEITFAPEYNWGQIKGNGPIFSAQATKQIYDGDGGIVTVTFNLSVSNPDAVNYQSNEYWAVNESVGYKSVASLVGATVSDGEIASRFQFVTDGENSNTTYIRFYIRSKAGEKLPIDVKWVVFTDNSTYYTIESLKQLGGAEIKINGGGFVTVEDDKFVFAFNGAKQSVAAICEFEVPNEDNELYEILSVNTADGLNAGKYTVSLAPSYKYDYKDEDSECEYSIKPLEIKLNWGDTTFVYNGKERVPAPTIDTEYLDNQPDWYKKLISSMTRGSGLLSKIPATGETDAGEYESECNLGNNFTYADDTGRQTLIIKPFAVVVSAVKWDFTGAKNSTQGEDGSIGDNDAWYWDFDGYFHAPVPSLTVRLDSSTSVTLKLATTGSAKTIGSHVAFAWLDLSDDANKNFILVASSGSTVPVIAERKFSIAKRVITAIYWEGFIPDGETDELKKDGLLAYEYDGTEWAPKAYYIEKDNSKVYFTVEGAMKGAGKYPARITEDFDFKDEAGKPISSVCEFIILPRVIEVEWQGNAENDDKYIWTYNGAEQNPTVVFDEDRIVDGDDLGLSIKGYVNAGNHVAELSIKNPDYAFSGSATCAYIIERRIIDVVWMWSGADGFISDGVTPYWQYRAAKPQMEVEEVKITLGEDEVTFKFGYDGITSGVGAHTASAKIIGATVDGADIDLNNFIINEDTASQVYEITPYIIMVEWTGNAENGTYSWVYDGETEFAPTAKYTLWDGVEYNATELGYVIGAGKFAGNHVASVLLPEDLRSNCKFYVYEDGENAGKSCGEQTFTVLRKKVYVAWTADVEPDENGTYSWVYDGNVHSPVPYIKDDDGNPTTTKLQVTDGSTEVGKNYIASASLPDSANYEFATENDSTCYYSITVRHVSVRWIDDSGENTPAYSWYYSPRTERAPKAVIANADGSEFLIDGKPVYAIVSGGATDAGDYVATAAIASYNYAFPAGAHYTQEFHILKVELGADDFWWEDGTEKDGWFEYVFNGTSQHPTARAKGAVEFAYEFFAVNADDKTQTGTQLGGIIDAGTYKLTVIVSNNRNYSIPSGMEAVYVKITPKTLGVKWSTEKLVYNGANQKPAAYYEDLNGNIYPLEVNVEAPHADAGTYHATAAFKNADDVKNYVLDEDTTTQEFEIARRSIRIDWGAASFPYDGEGHKVDSKVYLDDALPADMNRISVYYVILDKNGVEIAGANTVTDAGLYKMEMRLSAPPEVLKNYILADTDDSDATQAFEIVRRTLLVTVKDCEVEYLDNAPVYEATYGKEVENDGNTEIIHGFLGDDGEDTIKGLIVNGIRPWIDCEYVSGYTPGTYDITIDAAMLSALLPNYKFVDEDGNSTCFKGTLTVTAADGTVIWYGDRMVGDPNFMYNGREQKPTAYLVGEADPLDVVYVDKDGNELTDFKAINASDEYYVKAIAHDGVTIEKNQIIRYEIKPREVTIIIHRFEITYGDRQISDDGSDVLTEEEIKKLWSFNEGSSTVGDDDLEITLIWNVVDGIKNGYLNTGVYYLEGKYNNNPNYNVIFEGVDNDEAEPDKKQYGLYVVKNASIIDNSKQGTEWFYEESVIEKYEKYFIRIEDKEKDEETGEEYYKYVKFAGDQTAQASFAYSTPYLVGRDEIPAPDEHENYPNTDKNHTGISDKGIWIINYRIEIPNHNTYYGRWTVLIKLAEEYVIIIFVRPYEIQYGENIPENLAEILVDEGYVEISGAITDKEYFKEVAEAYVPLGYNKYVTNRTKVGSYNPCFRLNIDRDEDDPELDVIYRRNNRDEDSNLGMYLIKPRQIYVVWGQTEFTYDKELHVPMPVLSHWIEDQMLVLEGIENGKAFVTTDAGATITVTVTTEGNFKASGGHRVVLAIDDPNYLISASDAVQVISIKGSFPWWLVFLLGALTATAIITFITLITKLKHRNATIARGIADREGFYDPLYYIDDAGFNDPYYGNDGGPTIGDDGFDYDEMWSHYTDYLN